MKTPTTICLVLLLALAAHASSAMAGQDSRDADRLAALTAVACAEAEVLGRQTADCRAAGLERTEIVPGIAWYQFTLRVGDGPHDVVRLHRVVAEDTPYVPRRTRRAIMMLHGDRFTWEATFLSSVKAASIPDDQAIAAFLAAQGVDVWGLDFRWVLVPEDVEDTSFMDDWGMQLHVDDVRRALAVARVTRLLTGSGFGKLHLLGWSRGGFVGYAYLNDEVQRPRFLRHVRGFVPTDMWIRTDDASLRAAACDGLADLEAGFEAGETVGNGLFLNQVGRLALDDPDSPSPFFSLFTNRQLGLCVGTFPRNTPTPGWHPVGGVYDDDFFFPQFLLHSDEVNWFTHLADGAPFQPLKVVIDGETLVCNETDSPFDDHLAAVDVPVLYVGAEGAFGAFGLPSTTLLGSEDVSSLVVSVQPPELQIRDFGHADLFLATDAATLVWQPIVDWIEAH